MIIVYLQAGDGVSVVRGTTRCEPTEPEARERGPGNHMLRADRAGGETEPTGFEVSPCFEKKKPQTKSEASFFEAGDGNRTHVFSLEG